MRMRVRWGRKQKTTKLWRWIAVLLCVVLLFVALDYRLRPVITTMAQYQCRTLSMIAMNEAVMEELSTRPELTQHLVSVEENTQGAVTSVRVNSAAVNQMRAQLTAAASARLLALEQQDISIPLGTLVGWQLMAGRGPSIHLKVVPASFVQATTKDTFDSAGINQTKHSVYIHFVVEMSAILPGYSTSVQVENEVCVAQTLIVGDVPQFYAS